MITLTIKTVWIQKLWIAKKNKTRLIPRSPYK